MEKKNEVVLAALSLDLISRMSDVLKKYTAHKDPSDAEWKELVDATDALLAASKAVVENNVDSTIN